MIFLHSHTRTLYNVSIEQQSLAVNAFFFTSLYFFMSWATSLGTAKPMHSCNKYHWALKVCPVAYGILFQTHKGPFFIAGQLTIFPWCQTDDPTSCLTGHLSICFVTALYGTSGYTRSTLWCQAELHRFESIGKLNQRLWVPFETKC